MSPARTTPDLDTVRRLAERQGAGAVPLSCEVLADLETPPSAFLRLAHRPNAFLLESVEGGQHLARYSFLGFDLQDSLVLREGSAQLTRGDRVEELPYTDPLTLIDGLVARPGVVRLPGMPRFVGGAVGYLSYEAARCFERLPAPERDRLGLPLGHLMLVDTLLVFDHLRRTAMAITHIPLDGDVEAEYRAGQERLERVLDQFAFARMPAASFPEAVDALARPDEVRSNFSRAEFEQMVRRAKEHIVGGDVIQVVVSQRLELPCRAPAFSVYRALRSLNPSPYLYFLDFGSYQIIGASPELLVLVEDGVVSTHPIAGTRPRGRTPEQDQHLARELLQDEKERAEHVMLVDLGRNDIGRVSVPGSVTVPQLMEVEYYSHVMHIVSHVQGRLRSELRPVDALRACFPAGTVSGAPKIRAMELIAEFEPERRGPYAGAVGFFGLDGDVEAAITIRTIVLQDGVAHVQAGAGIVADSDPATEYQETLSKAEALLSAVRRAESVGPLTPTLSQ
ncbi:MAG: anthranilate synthase component I, partial [Chloroflexi bacterium]|nr:anthranilate synthase component I [Chloroflexota bacterium]